MRIWYITEQCNLILESLIKRLLGAAYDDIRLDTHALKLLNTGLCRLCLKLSGSTQIRDQCNVTQDCILVSDFVLELTDCLKERLTFDISDGSADFDDGDMHIIGSEVAVKTTLDFVRNM